MPTQSKKSYELERVDIVKKFFLQSWYDHYRGYNIIKLKRLTRVGDDFTYHTVRVRNPEELATVKTALDYLSGKIGWQELPSHLAKLQEELEKQKKIDPEIVKLVEQYPRASIEVLKAFDKIFKGKVDIEDLPIITEYMETILGSLQGKQKSMIELQLELIEKLGTEDEKGKKRLLKLLEQYRLPQLTSVTSVITDRLQKLALFDKHIQTDDTYEIKGKNSIHNQLARALWILDDRYWLLRSNQTLTNQLGKSYEKQERNKRPDFICADFEKRLVIVEIKRPSISVKRKHINQLEDYLVLADEFKNYDEKQGFLIAQNIKPHLRKNLDLKPNISFRSYVDVVDQCKTRYKEYLDAINKET
jgi:hypothetical protein